jgi:hypothetical protein
MKAANVHEYPIPLKFIALMVGLVVLDDCFITVSRNACKLARFALEYEIPSTDTLCPVVSIFWIAVSISKTVNAIFKPPLRYLSLRG